MADRNFIDLWNSRKQIAQILLIQVVSSVDADALSACVARHTHVILGGLIAIRGRVSVGKSLGVKLDAFGLMPTLRQSLATLSLGQHKKVQLALALSLPVRLLLIDEPFNGLDAGALDYLRRQLSDPARLERACIVLTSHLDPLVPVRRTLDLD